MKVGTVSKVMLGGNADVAEKAGIIVDADVILGKAEGRTKDLKGLVLSNKLMFGKSVSRAKIATVSGVPPLVLADAISANVINLIAFGSTEHVAETYIDTVTAEGKCQQVDSLDPTALPTPTAPIDIVCNNGVLKYGANGDNLFDESTVVTGYYYNDSGTYLSNNNTFTSDKIPMGAQTSVEFSRTAAAASVYLRIHAFDSNDNWLSMVAKSAATDSLSVTGTTPNNTAYIKVCGGRSGAVIDSECQVKKISIYTDGTVETVTDNVGNTATCEMLLGVGNYTDQQEIVVGTVTRNVGIKVLDGTETWAQTTTNVVEAAIMTGQQYGETAMCSHLSYSSAGSFGAMADDSFKTGTAAYKTKIYCKSSIYATDTTTWKQFLSTQYANGTPVIIVYPLETSATETATGQILTKAPVTATGSLTGLVVTAVSSSHTTPNPYEPLDINCNNGVLKYGNVSKNLFDEQYPNVSTSFIYMPIYLGPGTYTCSYSLPQMQSNSSMVYFLNGNVSAGASNNINRVDADTPRTITTSTGYVTIAYRKGDPAGLTGQVPSDYNCMIEKGQTATPYEPYRLAVYADGTVETIGVKDSKNLLPVDAQPDVLYPVTVPGATNWTASANVNNGQNLAACEIRYYNENKQQIDYYTINGYSDGRMYKTFSVTTAVKYVSISRKSAYATTPVTELKVETGNTMTPYFNGGTATAEMLLSIGTSTDEQEVIAGNVTRKIGIKVLDGTEDWTQSAATNNLFYTTISNSSTDNAYIPISSHFQGVVASTGYTAMTDGQFKHGSNTNSWYFKDANCATATAFSQWLATQYAAGTPVIVVYPLTTSTTETVTGQPMSVQQGTNIVEITQAALDDLELEVSYYAGAEVTVTEIENAQLSSDVEVTIS